MPTNLTGNKIKDTFSQLLHIDGGPASIEKQVLSATGTGTAMFLGTASGSIAGVRFSSNNIRAVSGTLTITDPAITGGSISGITDLAVADGGTGASTASAARTNLGLGTMAVQDSTAVTITGGTLSGVALTGTFTGITAISATEIEAVQRLGYATGQGAGGAVTQLTSRTTGVTLNAPTGAITLFAGSLSGHEADEFTLTNSFIGANDVVLACIKSGCAAATRKYYQVHVVQVSAGSCVISVGNIDNATIPSTGTDSPVIQFTVIKGAIT